MCCHCVLAYVVHVGSDEVFIWYYISLPWGNLLSSDVSYKMNELNDIIHKVTLERQTGL